MPEMGDVHDGLVEHGGAHGKAIPLTNGE
jgi:hypothetical protein